MSMWLQPPLPGMSFWEIHALRLSERPQDLCTLIMYLEGDKRLTTLGRREARRTALRIGGSATVRLYAAWCAFRDEKYAVPSHGA